MARDPLHIARLAASWIIVAAAAGLLAFSAHAAYDARSLHQTPLKKDTASRLAEKCLNSKGCSSPAILLKLSETLADGTPDEQTLAHSLITRSLENDDLHPGSWALKAYLDTQISGRFNMASAEAMRQSLKSCPLCNNIDLLRWRFTFVLHNWENVPEDVRKDVFESADFLRWWYVDADFLKEQSAFARNRGIPFGEYRSKVDTPVRPNEIRLPN